MSEQHEKSKSIGEGWNSVPQSDVSAPSQDSHAEYTNLLRRFLDSGAKAWKREHVMAGQLAGLYSARDSNDKFKGISIESLKEAREPEDVRYGVPYTVWLLFRKPA
jgi:hypothetical protein